MLACGAVFAEAGRAKRRFDLSADDAATSLRVFMEQSGTEIVYPADTVRGTRTNAVKGEYTPREAIEKMLAGTRLVASETKNGVLSINHVNDPNGQRAAQGLRRDRPEKSSHLTLSTSPSNL